MKIKAIGLVALGAVMALVSCQKETTTTMDDSVKEVTINLANINLVSKSSGGIDIQDNTTIDFQSCQIFFTDGSTLFSAKDAEGKTSSPDSYYFTQTAEGSLATTYHFHLLPAGATKVVVIGNRAQLKGVTTYSQLDALLQIDQEQKADGKGLSLYGEAPLTPNGTTVYGEGDAAKEIPLYKAVVNLKPRIARFYIDAVTCDFTEGAPVYDKIQDIAMGFNYYYKNVNLISGNASSHQTAEIGESTVWNWFEELASILPNDENNAWRIWTYDDLTAAYAAEGETALALVPGGQTVIDTDLYYHFFVASGTRRHVPMLVLKAVGYNDDVPTPLYLSTMRFFDENDSLIEKFEEGWIYKMDFRFKDTDFNKPDKCVDVQVTVQPWNVVLVTPDFGSGTSTQNN